MEKLYELLKNRFLINEENMNVTFRQLGVDSLEVYALVCEIEELCEIEFDVDELDNIESVADLCKCVSNKIKK